ncbi:LysR family transcriptional regulator, glycine cleavage system transcriptional activator [Rhizobiales bacterium GAS191]|nr:LysR family transcriptional regulator, glycine cleavage system transcriptional activator [Rhizobiales bacterium GAS191]
MASSPLPFRGMAVFEAASRLGSFRSAAVELNLTPSAVSHQIRLLEQTLGVTLFTRVGRGVSLSDDGVEYARTVRQAFSSLRQATDDMVRRGKAGNVLDIVRMQTPPSFASRWLLPRLPLFMVDNPGIDIRVNAEVGRQSKVGDADLMIVYGEPGRWQDRAVPFLRETIQPLCSPALLAGGLVKSPADLADLPLIKTRDNSVSWEDWFRHWSVDLSRPRARAIQLDPSHVAIEAAIKGLGVILESDILTAKEMTTGKLVAPFPDFGMTLSSYWLLPPHRTGERSAVASVREWLRIRATVQGEPHLQGQPSAAAS